MSFKRFWAMISKKVGRPSTDWELIKIIRRIAKENPLWGAGKILGILLSLNFKVSETTIEKYIPPKPRDPEKVQRWVTFIRNHMDHMVAIDLFKIPSWNFRTIYTVMFFIHIGSRRIIHFSITENPTSAWCAQQLRNAFWEEELPGFMLTDNDPLFKGEFTKTVKSYGIRHIHTQSYSPWQNSYAERWVRTARDDCVNHIIPLSERHLMVKMKEFVGYYNSDRPHRSLSFNSPGGMTVTPKPSPHAKLVSIPVLGGLHHRYIWQHKAA
jgi:transposase InsO family protein